MCLRLCCQMVEEILHHLLSMKLHVKKVIFSIHQLVLNSTKRVTPWFQDLNIWKGISALMKHDSFRTPNILSLGPSCSETNWPARKQRKHTVSHPTKNGKSSTQREGICDSSPGGSTAAAAGILYLLLSVPAQLVGFLLDGKQKPKLIWEGTTNFFQVRAQPKKHTKTTTTWNHPSPNKKINQQFSDDVVFLVIKNDTCSDFLASPQCFRFLISGVSDSTPLSRSLGICFGSVVFLPQKSPGETGGKPTLKVALNIQNSQDFKTHVSSRVRGYMIYIYTSCIHHFPLLSLLEMSERLRANSWVWRETACDSHPDLQSLQHPERRSNHRNKWPTSLVKDHWYCWWKKSSPNLLVDMNHEILIGS